MSKPPGDGLDGSEGVGAHGTARPTTPEPLAYAATPPAERPTTPEPASTERPTTPVSDSAPAPDGEAHVSDEKLPPGSQVGEYEVIRRIGEGGMGVVYEALHPLIGKRVAIKLLSDRIAGDGRSVVRFVQEARAVNQIGHRNIVDIFLFGQLPDGRHYYVMEFLDGESLSRRLERQGKLTPADAIAVALPVCEALAAAHRNGIIHRDLKPDNVFMADDRAGGEVVKLLDFGIAKLESLQGVGPTATGAPIGTPYYMAPEQCRGLPVDARADLYALGVMLFELLTGKMPFEAPTFVAALSRKLTERPGPPGRLVPLPPGLDRLVQRLMAEAPEDRPESAIAVRDELLRINKEQRLLGTQTVERLTSSPPNVPARARWKVAAALSALAVLAVGGWFLLVPAGRTQPTAVAAAPPDAASAQPLPDALRAQVAAIAPPVLAAPAGVDAAAPSPPRPVRAPVPRKAPAERAPSAAAATDPSAAAEVGTGWATLDVIGGWAMVEVDGRALGQTPKTKVQLPSGSHVARFANVEQGWSREQRFKVESGKTAMVRVVPGR